MAIVNDTIKTGGIKPEKPIEPVAPVATPTQEAMTTEQLATAKQQLTPTSDVTQTTPETAPKTFAAQTQPGVAPVTSEVNAPTETVEERLARLTAGGSKYVEQAKRQAMQAANARGLISSSMAAGAGEAAAINAALPIASQDAGTYTQTRMANQQTQNEFLKNQQSANLNKEMASLENNLGMEKEAFSAKLKTDMDKIISNNALSNEMKVQFVSSINKVMGDTQQQITDIGLSDRSPEQQATAIQLAMDNRDATIAVYQDLLGGSTDWDWGTDFTPGNVYAPTGAASATGGAQNNVVNAMQSEIEALGPAPSDFQSLLKWQRDMNAIKTKYNA